MECRIIFYLNKTFLHFGGIIKLVNENKIFNWYFKMVFLKNCLNEQKRRGGTSCWSCHFQAAELWIWNNKIETYKTVTLQLYSMYLEKETFSPTQWKRMYCGGNLRWLLFLLLSSPCAYHSKIRLNTSSYSFHDCFFVKHQNPLYLICKKKLMVLPTDVSAKNFGSGCQHLLYKAVRGVC